MTQGIRITGILSEDAQLGYTPGLKPTATLHFELCPAKGLPYRVRQHLGEDPSAHLSAAAKLVALRRGAEVAVYGAGLRAQSDFGHAALFVLDVTDVHPLSMPPKAAKADPSQED